MNSLKPVQPAESNMSLEDFQSEDDSSTTYNKGFIVNHDRDDEEIKISRGRIQLRKGFIYLNKLTNEKSVFVTQWCDRNHLKRSTKGDEMLRQSD